MTCREASRHEIVNTPFNQQSIIRASRSLIESKLFAYKRQAAGRWIGWPPLISNMRTNTDARRCNYSTQTSNTNYPNTITQIQNTQNTNYNKTLCDTYTIGWKNTTPFSGNISSMTIHLTAQAHFAVHSVSVAVALGEMNVVRVKPSSLECLPLRKTIGSHPNSQRRPPGRHWVGYNPVDDIHQARITRDVRW